MRTATTRTGRPLVEWSSWNSEEGAAWGKRRRRGEALRRLEWLEDRRLLAATINIDGAALLNYATDAAVAETLTISVAGTIYTFTSDQTIDIATNTPGLTVTGDGTNTVTVDGISGLAVDVNTAASVVSLDGSTVPTTFGPGASPGGSQLNLGDGDLSSLTSAITVTPGAGVGTDFNILVNGSSAAAAGVWKLASTGATSELTGIGAGASLTYTPSRIGGMTLANAAGLANSLTVDFGVGNPLPTAIMAYNGGATGSSSAKSDLILIGDPATAITSEAHTTGGATGGAISFLEGSHSTGIDYAGVSSHSVYDTVATAAYVFNYTGSPSVGLTVSDGENSANTGSVQTLKIASDGATPEFVDTHIANKTAVTINQTGAGDYRSTVNYAIATPVAGLTSLNLVSGSGSDAATLTALPPGVATSVQQGGGNDQIFVTLAGTTLATSTTLDGGAGTDSLSIDAGGLAVTAANFTVNPDGSTTISGTPVPGPGVTYQRYESVTVTNAAPIVPTVYGVPIHGTEGQQLVNVLVGAFTVPAGSKASDFVASVAWGDGGTGAGTIVQDASNPSIFYIYGTHTYQRPGNPFTTTITVKPLGSTTATFIGGVPVTIITPPGDPVSQNQQAFIQDAGLSLSVQAFAGVENTPLSSSFQMVVATFTDLGGVDPNISNPATQYTATIYWGDGTAGVGSLNIDRNGVSSQFIVSAAPHTYAFPGTYSVTVVVKQADGGATAIASNVAHIADAALSSPSQPITPAVGEGTQFVGMTVGWFADANPLATTGEYEALVDWGDGTGLQAATVIQPGGPGTLFYVVGDHAYANAHANGASPIAWPGTSPTTASTTNGTYKVTVYVTDTYGSAVDMTNTVTVVDRALSVYGGLDSASDTGVSNTDGVTKDSTPTFTGWVTEGGSIVAVYAALNGGSPTLIGTTTADAAGAWSFTPATALVDGGYTITAQAFDAAGHAISGLATVRSGLVIDTLGPKITDVLLDGWRGQVIVTFNDYGGVSGLGSGLVASAVRDANNYAFTKLLAKNTNLRPWLVTSVTVSPGTTTGEQVATIQFNGGAQIRGGKYLLKVLSADAANLSGIRDVAGNALDGEYYGYFPSGNNVNGGNFVAELDAIHHTVYPARTQVGTATPVSPPGRAATGAFLSRNGTLTPSASSAVKLSAARQTASAARAARLAALRS